MGKNARHILIVEDDAAHARLIRRAFDAWSTPFNVTFANSLREARIVVRTAVPDLVIADLSLPDGRGVELVPDENNGPLYPVVLLTGHGNEMAAAESIKRGALDYVVKSSMVLAEVPRVAERALREWRHICARKRAEVALRESEARLRTITANAPDFILQVDREGTIVYINRVVPGKDIEDVLGTNGRNWLPPASRHVLSKVIDEVFKQGSPCDCEVIVPLFDGSEHVFACRIAPVRNDENDEEVVSAIVIARDISSQKRTEEALRDSESLYRSLVENVLQNVFRTDLGGRITFANRHFCETLGKPLDEIVGKREHDLLSPDSTSEDCLQDHFVIEAAGTVEAVREYRLGSGRTLYAQVIKTPIRDSRNGIVGIQAILSDVTELRRAEDEARQHLAELVHVSRLNTVGEMAAGIAHELNQPLAAIANYVCAGQQIFANDGVNGKKRVVELFDKVRDQAVRAGEIVRRLRQLAQKNSSHRSHIDLNELVKEVIALLKPESRFNGINLQLNLDKSIPKVWVDAVQIEQVVLNLVKNAIEAMDGVHGGQRTVTIESFAPGHDRVELAITDCGKGIPESDMGRIFTAFFSTKPQGMGMGLAICQTIVKNHAGHLWAESLGEHGATFRFTLPVGRGD